MKYYIAENGQPSGPFEIDELIQHGLTVNSLVWNDSLTGWTKASDVVELQPVLSSAGAYVPPVTPTEPPAQEAYSPYAPQQPAEPTPQQPAYAPQQPVYEPQQPQQGQPVYAQPQYAQPQYGQPQYGQQPQQPFGPAPMAYPPSTNKVMAIIVVILSFLCCCNIVSGVLGIISLVKGSAAMSRFNHGDAVGASEEAKTASTLAIAGLIAMVILPVIMFILMMCVPETRDAFMEGYYQGAGQY